MRRDPSHSSGMVQESSAACRASMGLAFKASSDPKHAGGDPPRPPRRNKRRRSLHPPRSKFRLLHPKNAFSSSRAFRRICIVWGLASLQSREKPVLNGNRTLGRYNNRRRMLGQLPVVLFAIKISPELSRIVFIPKIVPRNTPKASKKANKKAVRVDLTAKDVLS